MESPHILPYLLISLQFGSYAPSGTPLAVHQCCLAIGIGEFMLNDGSTLQFTDSLQLFFDFRAAIANGTIQQIFYASDCYSKSLKDKLSKLQIEMSQESLK